MSHNRHSYVPFYPSDWLGGTARMTRLHKSVYFDVCCYNWDTARACPAGELPLMLGDLPNWRDLVEDLIAAGKLNRDDDGGLWNPRAMGEAEKAFDLWKRKSTGGKRGAAKTNTGDGTPDGTPDGSVSGSSPKTGKTPDAEPEPEPEPEPKLEDDEDARARKTDLPGLAARFGRAAGVAVSSHRPTQFTQQIDAVREWMAMGLDPDTEIIPALEQATVDDPITRHSLRYFTPMMAKIAARKDAQANGKQRSDTVDVSQNRTLRAAEAAKQMLRARAGSTGNA